MDKVRLVPRGKVTTYAELAQACGRPGAARAVGNALSKNPRPVEVPCHRVVRSDGRVGGYSRGQKKKIGLLEKEGVEVKAGKVGLGKFLFRFLTRTNKLRH